MIPDWAMKLCLTVLVTPLVVIVAIFVFLILGEWEKHIRKDGWGPTAIVSAFMLWLGAALVWTWGDVQRDQARRSTPRYNDTGVPEGGSESGARPALPPPHPDPSSP